MENHSFVTKLGNSIYVSLRIFIHDMVTWCNFLHKVHKTCHYFTCGYKPSLCSKTSQSTWNWPERICKLLGWTSRGTPLILSPFTYRVRAANNSTLRRMDSHFWRNPIIRNNLNVLYFANVMFKQFWWSFYLNKWRPNFHTKSFNSLSGQKRCTNFIGLIHTDNWISICSRYACHSFMRNTCQKWVKRTHDPLKEHRIQHVEQLLDKKIWV
jgi:hypothetical protein